MRRRWIVGAAEGIRRRALEAMAARQDAARRERGPRARERRDKQQTQPETATTTNTAGAGEVDGEREEKRDG